VVCYDDWANGQNWIDFFHARNPFLEKSPENSTNIRENGVAPENRRIAA
jgi:hypothetical protein